MLEPKGWRLREAWDVTATPDAYRTYVQRSRGEFSCAKPAYVSLDTAWVSDRTLCYLASGKPAVVQHTGASRILPDAEGLLRFRSIDEAARALAAAEADYERHGRAARALVEEHFDARRVVASVLERALEPRVAPVPRRQGVDLPRELLADLLDGTGRVADIRRLKERVYRLEMTNGPHRSVVAKRLEPAVAQRTRLVAERWLPALGLGDRCPRLLATAADGGSASIWHAFEDLGDETLERPDSRPRRGDGRSYCAAAHPRRPPPGAPRRAALQRRPRVHLFHGQRARRHRCTGGACRSGHRATARAGRGDGAVARASGRPWRSCRNTPRGDFPSSRRWSAGSRRSTRPGRYRR